MADRLGEALTHIARIKLPGHAEYLAEHPDSAVWIDGQRNRTIAWKEDGNVTQFEKSLRGYVRGMERINELIADLYANDTDSECWDLRYVRWMPHLIYILFDSEKWGEFKVYREHPQRPDVKQWFTVDEMIDMLENPLFPSILEAFETFPCRPESLGPPGDNEKHLALNVTKDGVSWSSEFGRRTNICDDADEIVREVVSPQLCLETE
ncbi:MAG: hypothetical protein DRP42_00550 [Tenericutes bacterium]|nr:MAG: hypothetical protein DRP42_00550 [Mycoplasmatota bacterium]